MATTLKILGQSNPPAASGVNLYTVPSGTSTVVSSLSVCNTSATSTTFRIATRPAGATLATVHYLYYDVTIAGNDTFVATLGISLATTDVITVYAGTANLVFHAYGQENT